MAGATTAAEGSRLSARRARAASTATPAEWSAFCPLVVTSTGCPSTGPSSAAAVGPVGRRRWSAGAMASRVSSPVAGASGIRRCNSPRRRRSASPASAREFAAAFCGRGPRAFRLPRRRGRHSPSAHRRFGAHRLLPQRRPGARGDDDAVLRLGGGAPQGQRRPGRNLRRASPAGATTGSGLGRQRGRSPCDDALRSTTVKPNSRRRQPRWRWHAADHQWRLEIDRSVSAWAPRRAPLNPTRAPGRNGRGHRATPPCRAALFGPRSRQPCRCAVVRSRSGGGPSTGRSGCHDSFCMSCFCLLAQTTTPSAKAPLSHIARVAGPAS